MSSDAAASYGDPGEPEPGPVWCYEPVVGTLVLGARDRGLLVEFDGPDGEYRQRTALALTPIESTAAGHPVELMFVEGDLDRPVITKLVDWKAELLARWVVLGRKVLGLESGPRKLEMLIDEFTVLACVAAWFAMHGNKTRAANLIGTSRKVLRDRTTTWKSANPRLVPPAKGRKGKPRKSRTKARKAKAEGHTPAPDGGVEQSDGSKADG